MKTKGFWVIKTSAGTYWCSGNFDSQIRKAHVYTWKEKAEEMIVTMVKRKYLPAEITYEVVAIAEPRELRDTVSEWVEEIDDNGDLYFWCMDCEVSALNDYRGNSVNSKFCPNCGKRMINSTMSEDA